jgi:proteic killer suppression protein
MRNRSRNGSSTRTRGNRLHALEGDRKGQYSISINDQWRICFRFVDGDAYDVEVCDYH